MNYMKKILFLMLALFVGATSSASIITEKQGKYLAVSFIDDGNVSEETVKQDFYDALAQALAKKCSSVAFRDKNGIFYYVNGKESLRNADGEFLKFMDEINKMQTESYVPGEVIGTRKVWVSGPKYHLDTYCNGIIESTHESDWEHGPFAKQESTTRIGNDTYKTVIYYTPDRYKTVEIREPSEKIITPGIDVFISKAYIKKQ